MARQFTLGIDLGTTNSVAAVWLDGRPFCLPIQNQAPRELLRSVVLVESEDHIYVGEQAWNRRMQHPDRLIQSVKAEMGNMDKAYRFDGREYTPADVSSIILQEIVRQAKRALEKELRGQEIEFRNLVVTVPARFSPNARRATAQAIGLAGYAEGDWRAPKTQQLLLESDAAALAYIRSDPHRQTVLVYDLGGGTFDVSVMEFTGDAREPFRPLGPAGGDPRLGGDVFDQRVFARMVEHFNTGGDLRPRQRTYPDYFDFTTVPPEGADPRAWLEAQQLLLDESRRFKEALCSAGLTEDMPHEVILPELLGRSQAAPFSMTRAEFHALIGDRIEATATEVRRLLKEFGISTSAIDRVVLAGGSTRIPAVRAQLKSIFGIAPNDTLEPDKAVAIGAAIYAELREVITPPQQKLTVDVGIKVTKRVRESIVGFIGHDRELRDMFEAILPRGTDYPGERKKTVTTVRDHQKTMRFQIYQNDAMVGDGLCSPSNLMAWFDLSLPEEALGKKGKPQVEITFKLNSNGTTVDVAAVETTTKRSVEHHLEMSEHGKPPPEEEGGSGLADIVVIMDTTMSMKPCIKDMQRLTKEFASKVGSSGVDYQLALVDYRDLKIKERLLSYPFTKNVDEFQKLVDKLDASGGGDEPESAIDAIERALELRSRPDAQRILILITDASTHDPGERGTSISSLNERLQRDTIALYVVAPPDLRHLYGKLITVGRFFEMGRPFDDILSDVARDIRDITLA